MLSDIEIAQRTRLLPIDEVAKQLGATEIEQYGRYKAKLTAPPKKAKGKLILVTAINPTPLGEGKTTVSIGLADAMKRRGNNVCLALREPSLGPVFGIKGGAAGGGYAQVAPMEDINLHFTGDLHAITSANNLLSALIDNHIHFGNSQGISNVTFRRCQDVNDRALRNIVVGLGTKLSGIACGVPREDGFDITAASEIMATLCLSEDLTDLKKRLGSICIGNRADGSLVFARDLGAEEALAILLKDAIKPNLVQTLEGTPALVHGGPFANIAHGCNTAIATKTALGLADYVVTEAGFGADLGAEKFLDIKCRAAGLAPSAVVIVATVRSLKYNGGADKDSLKQEDVPALKRGVVNLFRHIDNIINVFKLPCVVALNRFESDTDAELGFLTEQVRERGASIALTEVYSKGGEGGLALADEVVRAADTASKLCHPYQLSDSYEQKLNAVVTKVYGGKCAVLSAKAKSQIAEIAKAGFDGLPVCIAKTQYSFSDSPSLLGAPEGFEVLIREVKLRSGAGFVVAVAGDIMLMPGLPKKPNSEIMSISQNGEIKGLF